MAECPKFHIWQFFDTVWVAILAIHVLPKHASEEKPTNKNIACLVHNLFSCTTIANILLPSTCTFVVVCEAGSF